MLNNAAYNGVRIHGAASVALVFASATFTADATVTAAANVIHAAKADIVSTAHAVFDGTRIVHGRADWEATATPAFDGHRILAGVGDWTASLELHAVVMNTVYVEAAWEATAYLYMLPDAKLASADWVGTATFEAVPNGNGAAEAFWQLTANFTGDALVTREVSADWSQQATLHFEPTITTPGGQVTHDAFLPWQGTAQLEVDPALVDAQITELLWFGDGDWAADAIVDHGAEADWNAEGFTFFADSARVRSGRGNWEASSTFSAVATHEKDAGQVEWTHQSLWSAHALQNHDSAVAWEGFAELEANATQLLNAKANWEGRALMSGEGVRVALVTAEWSATAVIELDPLRTAYVNADWFSGGHVLAGAGVLRLVPAPESRTFELSDLERQFTLSNPNRQFALSGGRQKSEVSA